MGVNGRRLGHDMKQGHLGVERGSEGASESDGVVDKTFAAAAQKNTRQALVVSNCDQDRWLNCLDNFIGAMRLPGTTRRRASPRSDDNEIVFFGRRFSEDLPNRFPSSDDGLKRDAGLFKNIRLFIESLTQRLFLPRIFRNAQEGHLGFGRMG